MQSKMSFVMSPASCCIQLTVREAEAWIQLHGLLEEAPGLIGVAQAIFKLGQGMPAGH